MDTHWAKTMPRCLTYRLAVRSTSGSLFRSQKIRVSGKICLEQRRYVLSDAVAGRMKEMVEQHAAIIDAMQQGVSNPSMKEISRLGPVAKLHEELCSMEEEEASIRDLMDDAIEGADTEIEQECEQELKQLSESRARLEERITEAMLPRDEDDYGVGAILEVRAGTGGDEAGLFASELLAAYTKMAKTQRWKCEILSETRSDLGGVKEAALSIGGSRAFSSGFDDGDANFGPYGFFKYESGVHRVQRIPVNDVRIHTSACSVVVLPLPTEDANGGGLLPTSELRIDTYRASGAGGQHVNTTDSAVRVTHIPTGVTASIQDERSQHKNKDKALKLVAARVHAKRRAQAVEERSAARRSLMGGGDRSERIRTYNFPQDRVTDHRCKHSEHGIQRLLQGGEDEALVVAFSPLLRAMARDELIQELEQGQS